MPPSTFSLANQILRSFARRNPPLFQCSNSFLLMLSLNPVAVAVSPHRTLTLRSLTTNSFHEEEDIDKVTKEEKEKDKGNWHVRATPLLNILSISVHESTTSKNNGVSKRIKPFKIWGVIQLIDDQNHAYDIYSRESNKPEDVSYADNWKLSIPYPERRHGSSLLFPSVSSFKMRVDLKDDVRCGEIANGDFELNLMDEKINTKVVYGYFGYALIQYAILPYAVIANVTLRLTKNGVPILRHSYDCHCHVYGNIYATSKVKEGYISSVLFERPSSKPVYNNLKSESRLFRKVLAVPAYSSLVIKANLWDYDTKHQIARDVVLANFQAQDLERWTKQNCALEQNYYAQVHVDWNHAKFKLFEKGFLIDKPQLLSDNQQSSSSELINRGELRYMAQLLTKPCMNYAFASSLVELFSISVFPNTTDVNLRLRGTIDVCDSEGSYRIFERHNSNPEFMTGDMKIKSLIWPNSTFKASCFGMYLHLTDDECNEICKGYLNWNIAPSCLPEPWYGTRISSVIRGKHGHAVVHYSKFLLAVQAIVKIMFIPRGESDLPFKVNGDIVAQYSSFMYSSHIEKKLFRSTLFGDGHYAILVGATELMLQKSVVPVPGNSSLMLDMKLNVEPISESSEVDKLKRCETLEVIVDFNIDLNKTSFKLIEGDGFHIETYIQWT